MIYVLIFFAKLTEVTIATVRSVLANKGMKNVAALLASVEITLWLVVTANVLIGLQEDIFKGVAYGAAFVCGVFLGVFFEEKLALGLSRLQITADAELSKVIVSDLRELGYVVTSIGSEGRDGTKMLLMLDVKRKDVAKTVDLLQKYDNLYVTVSDLRGVKRGLIRDSLVK